MWPSVFLEKAHRDSGTRAILDDKEMIARGEEGTPQRALGIGEADDAADLFMEILS